MQRLDSEAKERSKRICAMRHHLEALHRRIVDRKHRLRLVCAGLEVRLTVSAFTVAAQHCAPVSASVTVAVLMVAIGRESPPTLLANTIIDSALPVVCVALHCCAWTGSNGASREARHQSE